MSSRYLASQNIIAAHIRAVIRRAAAHGWRAAVYCTSQGGGFHRGFPLLSQSLAAVVLHTTSKDLQSTSTSTCSTLKTAVVFESKTSSRTC